MLETVTLVKNADTAESTEAKNEDEVALVSVVSPVTVSLVAVVVASVVVPKTVKSPVEVAPVTGLAKNEVF